ncbi:uncharacterized protein PGTG_02957 [Puccinia graminis f. sp. tritici CRL 75-36-700-3]|uniref:Uncharacterized protein n=1 Tax=Puccinia graminis f. sp. tritici (strain CRL 75-36-700-3 / race SCCL) TaxID=418459 RepID=E3JWU1_PUCGT|nr:uncharacterized protein PGTG_02957 [Puccinia graminis f. sp. tritici CRL 75-36-700-3]EFP76516.1 hypothetical protein PGTG_02957 [Puccinia graminis f. sp. tritici CRL 75-36-700-3]
MIQKFATNGKYKALMSKFEVNSQALLWRLAFQALGNYPSEAPMEWLRTCVAHCTPRVSCNRGPTSEPTSNQPYRPRPNRLVCFYAGGVGSRRWPNPPTRTLRGGPRSASWQHRDYVSACRRQNFPTPGLGWVYPQCRT